MSTKVELKQLDKEYKLYTTLELHIGKMPEFTPYTFTSVIILGMKLIRGFKELTGVQKKEKLINILKLLIKEHGEKEEWINYEYDLINHSIDALYKGGILKKGCCF